MAYNLHPYQRAYESTDYPVFTNALNPYNYKNLGGKMIPYQKEQDMYYFTRQLNPISLINLGPQWMDPSNFPSDNRASVYSSVNLQSVLKTNQYQTPQNNSYLLRDQLPAKAGYYSPHDVLPDGVPRQISHIQVGKNNSFVPFHGMQLY